MKYVVIQLDETIHEFKEFKTKEEMEKYVYKYLLEALDIEDLKKYNEISPKEAKRYENKNVIYEEKYDWGENDRQTLHVLEVQDDGTWKQII